MGCEVDSGGIRVDPLLRIVTSKSDSDTLRAPADVYLVLWSLREFFDHFVDQRRGVVVLHAHLP